MEELTNFLVWLGSPAFIWWAGSFGFGVVLLLGSFAVGFALLEIRFAVSELLIAHVNILKEKVTSERTGKR